MRSTLFASCLLIFSFGLVGCEDAAKKDEAAAPATSAPVSVDPAAGKGAMEGPGGAVSAPAATPATPAPTPAPEEKKEAMPK